MLHHPWAVLQGTEEQTPPTDNLDGREEERRTDNNDTLGDSKKRRKKGFLGCGKGEKRLEIWVRMMPPSYSLVLSIGTCLTESFWTSVLEPTHILPPRIKTWAPGFFFVHFFHLTSGGGREEKRHNS